MPELHHRSPVLGAESGDLIGSDQGDAHQGTI